MPIDSWHCANEQGKFLCKEPMNKDDQIGNQKQTGRFFGYTPLYDEKRK